jgi:acyl carrier protein
MDISMSDLTLSAFRQVLDNPGIEPDDDFFAVGGDSVQALMALSIIEEVIGAEIPVAFVFTYPTAAELAQMVAAECVQPS